MDENEVELEEHFILRLPPRVASKVRRSIKKNPKKLKKKMKIMLDLEENNGTVFISKKYRYEGVLKKFPTIIESYETDNSMEINSLIYKTADISYFLDCTVDVNVDKNRQNIHGYTPPLKNVVTRRFRKTIVNPEQLEEFDEVVKELKFLLRADLEAISTTYIVILDDPNLKDFTASIFGSFSGDESDES